jgi:hypothetical protein
MNKSFFNGTDAQLYTGSNFFSQKIDQTPELFGLTKDQASLYASVNATYATAYLKAIDPDTRTKANVRGKNTARAALRTAASNLAKIIDGTPTVTDEQKIELGLAVRRKPSPSPIITSAPFVKLVSVNGRQVVAEFQQDSAKRGKPKGVSGVSIFSHYGEQPPVDPSGWQFEAISGRTRVTLNLNATESAGKVWISAFWFNARKQAGPASLPISIDLPAISALPISQQNKKVA